MYVTNRHRGRPKILTAMRAPGGTRMSEFKSDSDKPRREYEAPRFIHTEPLQARAINCAKENDANCGSGPISS